MKAGKMDLKEKTIQLHNKTVTLDPKSQKD